MSVAYTVALVVIARDEASRIARLLGSLRPWVHRMLVLDTGSVDDTVAIAQAHGAQVRNFGWCDDFAAARNAALDAAAADWHVVLDADEWLIDGGPALRALAQHSPDFVGQIELEDGFRDGPEWRIAHVPLSRVLPGAVRYAGRVHEQPQHRLPVQRLPLRVGHDGYTPERMTAKRGRNLTLLHKMLDEGARSDDGYLDYQLGKEHEVFGQHELAERHYASAAGRVGARAPWRFDLAARRLHVMQRCALHAPALAYAEGRLADCAESPDFFFALGNLLLDWAADEPDRAPDLLPLIETAWTRCLEIGEAPHLSGAVAGRGSTLAAYNLVVLFDGLGRRAEAEAMRRRADAAAPVPA